MPLTLASALKELDILSQSRVIAGRGGLDSVIQWTHIVDFPDVAPWVRKGDLLITTGFVFKDNPDAYLELIPVLAEKGLAGMIVAEIVHIPRSVIRLADELDFPIITVPWKVRFVELTQAIHERILSGQYALIDHSFHIHKVLTDLVLAGKGLDDLAGTLANLLERSVTIEDKSLLLLAHTSVGPIDEMRKKSIAQGRTPEEMVAYLHSEGIFENLRRDPRPQRVPSVPEMGMTLERIIAPILVGAELYGYVWIIAGESPLQELDFLAIERAATVAALILSREEAIYEAEQRVKHTLLDDLLELDPYHDLGDLQRTLARMGFRGEYQVMSLREISAKPPRPTRLATFLDRELQVKRIRSVVVQRGQRFIILHGTRGSRSGSELAHAIMDAASRNGLSLLIGLGSPSRDAARVRRCYQEAVEALQLGAKLSDGKPGVWPFQDLGVLHWMGALPPEILSASRFHRVVREMIDQDREKGTDCFRTLEVFLDCHGNQRQAAQKLYIHRNTLRQRLASLQETWSLDLKDPLTLLNLHLVIKDWRLNRAG